MLVTNELINELVSIIEQKDEGYLELFRLKLRNTRYDPKGLKAILLGTIIDHKNLNKEEDPLSVFISVFIDDFIKTASEIDNVSIFFG